MDPKVLQELLILINNLNGQFWIGFLEGLYQGFIHVGIALDLEGEDRLAVLNLIPLFAEN